jgi:O-antigen ligase
MTDLAYGHHGDGGVLAFIVHAAIWHVVGRVLYRVPLPVAIAIGVGLTALAVGRRRRRPR